MGKYQYQYDFSSLHKELYNEKHRIQKANKIISVLNDYLNGKMENLKLLDLGSSTGIMSQMLGKKFSQTIGIDIDERAVRFSKDNFETDNLKFYLQDAMNLKFNNNFFDVIICSHIYEHVPDSTQLLSEIYRVLKPGGICYFAAGNRILLIEQHYNIPLLSVLPKWTAHRILKLLKKGEYYYENHLTLWGLKKLVSKFEIIDYSKKIIEFPEKYFATDMIQQGSMKQKIYLSLMNYLYWACPTYIWLLKKTC